MIPRKIALFASGQAGLEIAKFLNQTGDILSAIYVSGLNPQLDDKIILASGVSSPNIRQGDVRANLEEHIKFLQQLNIDSIITVYWPYIVPSDLINLADITVNFHPALLPVNRGWFPHVHSIIDGSETGVTLHQLSEVVDAGDIWVQEKVRLFPNDVASDIYIRLQNRIVHLFKNSWDGIKGGSMIPFRQNEEAANYHSKNEINNLDRIDLDKTFKAGELINLLRARTFEENTHAYFEQDGKKYFLGVFFKDND
jgi:methionyl-tRNA formyltransferase